MLTKAIFFVLYLVISAKSDDTILLTMSPKEIINSFKSVLRSSYLRELANDFATKAAEYLIKEMRHNGKRITRMQSKKEQRIPTTTETYRNKQRELTMLNEEEVLTLLQDPSPDGDNLEKESAYLSDVEISAGDSNRSPNIPVIGETKINGIYFRRLLGAI